MPVLIGGCELLFMKVNFPEPAKLKAVEGKVYVSAFINENGECIDARILR